MQGAHIFYESLLYIKRHFARFWERRGGRDHIWLAAHDEGACWMPTEIYNSSIMLTHW